ncbi:MAG TPA: calcium/proton exchanger [Candidatus Limnocylindrales bacterium]|jgi:Ca2+:H+ antiporter
MTMPAMPETRATSGVPVLGVLSPMGRGFALATLALTLAAIALEFIVHFGDKAVVFVVSGLAILGLAWIVGLATERLGALTGPQVGGILNATFGNVAELIIAFFALQAGLIEVVKASLTGSIIGNLLLVLGASVFLGGIRHGTQSFDQRVAGSNAALLVTAAIALVIPAVFAASGSRAEGTLREESVIISVLLIGGYVLSLIYQFTNPGRTLGAHEPAAGHGGPNWTTRTAVAVLLAAAGLLAVSSEILVGAIDPFIESVHLSAFFVGVVVIPTIGNLAEHLVAVQLAVKNRMEFAMAVCYGSSLQVALFVAPLLVLAGLVIGQPMDLVFTPLEVAAVGAAVGISALIALDGESNWLEGALLMIVYVILAGAFFEVGRPV